MRYVLVTLFIFFANLSNAQSFVNYKDTINNFSINIPVGWKFGIPVKYPTIKLIAYRMPLNASDTSKDNFNINIIETSNLNLDKTYSRFLESLQRTDNFTIINQGDTLINGKSYKWLIETHNEADLIKLHNYDFLTYYNDKTYILTLVTFSYRFASIKNMFLKIAESLILTD